MRRPYLAFLLPALLTLPVLPTSGCKRETVGPSPENEVVSECYKPFFTAAALEKVDDLKETLSKGTVSHFEQDVFKDSAVIESWDDFASVYSDMKISSFIKGVSIEGDRAVVTDQVGGTFECVREDGRWKADLSDY